MVIILDQSSNINIIAEVLMASDYQEYAGLWGVVLTLTVIVFMSQLETWV